MTRKVGEQVTALDRGVSVHVSASCSPRETEADHAFRRRLAPISPTHANTQPARKE